MAIAAGTRVRTLYYYSHTGRVLRRRKSETLDAGWNRIRFDDGSAAMIHDEMLAVCNDQNAAA